MSGGWCNVGVLCFDLILLVCPTMSWSKKYSSSSPLKTSCGACSVFKCICVVVIFEDNMWVVSFVGFGSASF